MYVLLSNGNKQFLRKVLSHEFFKQQVLPLDKVWWIESIWIFKKNVALGNFTTIPALTVFYTMFEVTAVSSFIQA